MSKARIFTVIFLGLALYIGLDPFKHSAISEFPDFVAYKVDIPPFSQVPKVKDPENLLVNSEVKFLNEIQGPESIAFDPFGRGPYTGVADGRILFWNGQSWIDFAYTSPNRSEICNPQSSPFAYLKNEHICGRPLGLRFDKKTGDLYIADAYFGLLKVGPEGGLATPLTTEAEGVPSGFTNDLDIDEDGNVYFTDSSTNYQRRYFVQLIFSGEDSGRLLKYNAATKETTVLDRNLRFPNGVSLSKDGSFLILCESMFGRYSPQLLSMLDASLPSVLKSPPTSRLQRYWLKGEKAGTSEVFAILPGYPDNVRTNQDGEFWVAIHSRRTLYSYICALYPRFRTLVVKLPIPAKLHYLIHIGGNFHAVAMKFSPEGKLLQILEDGKGKVVRAISEVEEKDGKLWMGSVLMSFIAVYDLA